MDSATTSIPERTANWHLGDGAIAVWVYNRATGAVVASNEAAARLYGGALRGRGIDKLLADAALPRETHERVCWLGPLTHVRTDGSTFAAEVGLLSGDGLHTLVLVSPDDDTLGGDHERQ